MRKLVVLCASLCATALIGLAAPAQAQNTRSWVSASGSDNSPGTCTQAAPCLTFGHAIGQTSAGGEIDCLSGGDFGPVTIAQSITIDCGGQAGEVGVQMSGSDGIDINITSSATVVLRHLAINGFGSSGFGILVTGPGPTLIVEDCEIYGFPGGVGIYFQPTGSSRALLKVLDSAAYGNSGGIIVNPQTNVTASVVLDGIDLNSNNGDGLSFGGAGVIAGTLRNSVVAENGTDGISALTRQVYLTVEETSIIDNLSDGIQAGTAGVNLEVGASTIGGNGTGIATTAGSLFTFGNNQISANGSNGSFNGATPLE
jgi:hypothetical protein